ncbi:MAG: pyrroline-5-carboxylate reductase [Blastocatellia bacterium]|jgi:pyrroline-5-carboxylate reductase|nr:pyrroline-5-carboxylate reductase [Blastocatellia bacterium]
MSISNETQSSSSPQTDALKTARLSFIGCGVMAEAMIAGLLRQRLVKPEQITGSHPRPARRKELQDKYGIRVVESNRAAAAPVPATEKDEDAAYQNSIVVLAVKPQRLMGVLAELKGVLHLEQLVVSIVAGARIETISGELLHPAIVRAMPNTPAQIGEGMIAWTTTEEVTKAQQVAVRAMLGALGREMHVETERMIDMATALSATGPTYIFLVMEALTDAGVHMGFSRHVSQELVLQTMLGSVLFAQETRKHPAELRNMVTSPGGTSAEAIYQMEKGSLRTVLSKAVYAAFQRAVALGQRKA